LLKCLQPTLSKAPDTTARTSAPPIPVRRPKADMDRDLRRALIRRWGLSRCSRCGRLARPSAGRPATSFQIALYGLNTFRILLSRGRPPLWFDTGSRSLRIPMSFDILLPTPGAQKAKKRSADFQLFRREPGSKSKAESARCNSRTSRLPSPSGFGFNLFCLSLVSHLPASYGCTHSRHVRLSSNAEKIASLCR
jgi:hypothetical protein